MQQRHTLLLSVYAFEILSASICIACSLHLVNILNAICKKIVKTKRYELSSESENSDDDIAPNEIAPPTPPPAAAASTDTASTSGVVDFQEADVAPLLSSSIHESGACATPATSAFCGNISIVESNTSLNSLNMPRGNAKGNDMPKGNALVSIMFGVLELCKLKIRIP